VSVKGRRFYASPDGQAVDSRLTVQDVRLTEMTHRAPIKKAVEPRAALTLEARININSPLPRCRVNFEVIRNDGLIMFSGSPMVDCDPPIDLEAGTSLDLRIHFRANVLRGTYRIVLHLVDTNKLWTPIEISGLASFVVHETTRVAGCAELDPAYELSVSAPGASPELVVRAV